MTRTTHTILRQIAERAASHPSMEAAVIGAVRATLPGVIEAVLCEMRPGEQIRLYARKAPSADKQARDQRIGAALAAGESPESISKRENVSRRHLRRLRLRLGGHSTP